MVVVVVVVVVLVVMVVVLVVLVMLVMMVLVLVPGGGMVRCTPDSHTPSHDPLPSSASLLLGSCAAERAR